MRHQAPDPVGVSVLLLIAVAALVALVCCSFSGNDTLTDVMFDLVGLAVVLFWLACVRWLWLGLRSWKRVYDKWQPPPSP